MIAIWIVSGKASEMFTFSQTIMEHYKQIYVYIWMFIFKICFTEKKIR